jgi:hypothetical protein
VGETVKEGAAVTVNGAVVPFTDIVTGPAAAEPTTKDAPAVITPPPMVQTYEATTFGVTDVIVQIPLPVKPPPVTAIVWPCLPEVGNKVMPGTTVSGVAAEVLLSAVTNI